LTQVYNAFVGVLLSSYEILLDSGAYFLFGLLVAGLVNAFVSSASIAERLGGRSFKSVFMASFLGVPLPLCSCGVVPTALSLHDRGASKGAAVSFLISTPETGVDSISVSYALLDPLMTVFRPVAAFVTALFAGSAQNVLGGREQENRGSAGSECIVCGETEGPLPHRHGLFARLGAGIRYAFVELLGDISRWFLLGVLIAGAIGYFVPEGIIGERLGYGWPAMLLMALAGIPLYMCATSSTPIASALIAKGISPGAALVFLLTGPASNAASIVLVARFLGAKATAIYLSSILVSSILFGWVLNSIYIHFGLNARAIVGKSSEMIPVWLKTSAGILLLLLILYGMVLGRKKTCKHEHGKEHEDVCCHKD
jgi:uncharacterized membrane protein YraQ (UPF0718 family)